MIAAALASALTMPAAGDRDHLSAWFNDPADSVSIMSSRGFANDPDHLSIEIKLRAKEARILARFLLEAASKIEEGRS